MLGLIEQLACIKNTLLTDFYDMCNTYARKMGRMEERFARDIHIAIDYSKEIQDLPPEITIDKTKMSMLYTEAWYVMGRRKVMVRNNEEQREIGLEMLPIEEMVYIMEYIKQYVISQRKSAS